MDFATAVNKVTAGVMNKRGYQSDGSEGHREQATFDVDNIGHPLYVFPGYGVNQARNNGTDLEPIPVTPVKHQNWPEMQIQLMNGWMLTNWGKKLSYDDYLRMLTSSENKGRAYLAPGSRGVAGGNVKTGPSPLNVQSWLSAGPGAQANNPGGPGQTAGTVTNGGYYG